MADQGGESLMREYRKGNWTVGETLILIEGKRMEEERRMKRNEERETRREGTEPRWKWVENYCWRSGCLRSQNQCNDKWDNLMRDYKKVRDFERGERNGGLYWTLEKKERRERNLPANMVFQVYEALVQVVEKKGGVDYRPSVAALPPPPPPPPPALGMCDSSDANSDTPWKRTRRSMEEEEEEEEEEEGEAISRSAEVIAEALKACEERRERRHRDRVNLEERRLRIEESRTLIYRDGMRGLVEAINKLASFISTLASSKIHSSSK